MPGRYSMRGEQRRIEDIASGPDRFIRDQARTFNLDSIYQPYPMQQGYHRSTARHNFMGGAAGPGKTMAEIMEDFIACNEFSAEDGPKVHTLMLRRTYPQLDATVITRFRESIPKELYKQFNMTKGEVTWLNGATTRFGSMQYEHDVWGYQGEWFRITYDELCEFTFKQWSGTGAWNRCAVSPNTRKDGSGNPIGVGAVWVEDLFVNHRPCREMDENQRRNYKAEDYAYFPATYLDNPIYANDPNFLANLEAYPADLRDALKYGKWGVAGGYFKGIWDESIHVFPHYSVDLKPWWRRWISGNWGYEHPATFYKHCMDDFGVLYTYDEMFTQHEHPEKLAESVGKWAMEVDERGQPAMPKFVSFAFSFDAQYSKATATMGKDPRSVAQRMTPVLRDWNIPVPMPSTRDKLGRDTLMRELLAKRVMIGESAAGHPLEVPGWQISDRCQHLKRIIPIAKMDEILVEQIQGTTDGTDSPLQGAGYGLYAIFGRPAEKPREVQLAEVLEQVHRDTPEQEQTAKAMAGRRFEVAWQQRHRPVRRQLRWNRPGLPQ